MPKITKQALFDKTADHLLKQNCASMNESGDICAYRGFQGAMCAVGCLITDENYSEALEGFTIDTIVVREAVEKSTGHMLTEDEFTMLSQLQSMHDDSDSDEWSHDLKEIAEKHDLRFNSNQEED